MIAYRFLLLKGSTVRQAKMELSKLGVSNLYCIQDHLTKETFLGGTSIHPFRASLKHSSLLEEALSQQVDWERQWETFAENFYDGKAHIDLSQFGGKGYLLLKAGPGFGDLSHPTTHLMLTLMQKHLQDSPVIDIGCGSGILTLTALLLGAPCAIGIDIDRGALEHARQNASLNQLSSVLFLEKLPASLPSNNLLLLNTILPEQIQIMESSNALNQRGKKWITSGILANQRSEYLALAQQWGWALQEEQQEREWLGMVFVVYHL